MKVPKSLFYTHQEMAMKVSMFIAHTCIRTHLHDMQDKGASISCERIAQIIQYQTCSIILDLCLCSYYYSN